MGFLTRITSTVGPARFRAQTSSEYLSAFFSGNDMPDAWMAALSASGIRVTPDLAMTLSAMYCGVTTIAYDLATLPLLTYAYREDGGRDRIQPRHSDYGTIGIADLAYMLQWAPNDYQTSTEFFVGQIAQFLLRGKAYAEIVSNYRGAVTQLLPRHPDRVTPERLPNGNIRYKLEEASGPPRYLTQEEMHVVRDLATDPTASSASRITYGGTALSIALAAEQTAGKFFKSGMTASIIASYKGGEMEDESEKALHASITRYASGIENNFGLLLVPDDISISSLGVDPEKAQMMQSREWGVFDVARLLRISPRKLMIRSSGASYASSYQDAIDHVVNCIRPMAHTFELAIQRDLILEKDVNFVKFDLRELLRGDPQQMAEFIEKAIRNRAMRPSEVRELMLDLNPDPRLDLLSESDNQPGRPGLQPPPEDQRPAVPQIGPSTSAPANATMTMKGMLAVHDNAVRCLRRERVAVEKLAKKHAADVDGWRAALREFYADHAAFVAETMRLPIRIARGYAAQHGSALELQGVVVMNEDGWERFEADELAALAWNADGCSA